MAFAVLMRPAFRGSNLLARLGGDEFTVLLSNTPKELAEGVIERSQLMLDQYSKANRRSYDISFSPTVLLIIIQIPTKQWMH